LGTSVKLAAVCCSSGPRSSGGFVSVFSEASSEFGKVASGCVTFCNSGVSSSRGEAAFPTVPGVEVSRNGLARELCVEANRRGAGRECGIIDRFRTCGEFKTITVPDSNLEVSFLDLKSELPRLR